MTPQEAIKWVGVVAAAFGALGAGAIAISLGIAAANDLFLDAWRERRRKERASAEGQTKHERPVKLRVVS